MDRRDLFRPELADPFHALSFWDRLWIGAVSLSALAYAFLLPWGFVRRGDPDPVQGTLLALSGLILFMDLPLSIRHARTRADRWEPYRRGWLGLDLLAALPFPGVTLSLAGILPVAPWMVALPGLVKMVKLIDFLRAARLRSIRHADTISLAVVLLWALLSIHWVASGWLLLRGRESVTGFTTAYVDALYWTVTTITTVGYGDITPATSWEKLYAMATMVLGLSFFGYLVGLLASIWSRRNPGRIRFNENVERLTQAVRAAPLPPDLQSRIYDFYTYMWRERDWYDESDFLSELPANLREEVAVHLKQDILDRVEAFRTASPAIRGAVARRLSREVVTPGGVLFREGEEGDRMYFIVRGEVEILKDGHDGPVNTLGPGDFFGEMALIGKGRRSASVRAKDYVELYALSKKGFDAVMQQYPEAAEHFRQKARDREGTGRDTL